MKGVNLSIQKKLLFILICWIAVLSCFGLFTRVKMKELSVITERLSYGPLTVSNSAKEAFIYILKIQRGIKDQMLADNRAVLEEIGKKNSDNEEIVLERLEIINNHTLLEEISLLGIDTSRKFFEWRSLHKEILTLANAREGDISIETLLDDSNALVLEIEKNLIQIDQLAKKEAGDLVYESSVIENSISENMIYLLIGIIILFSLLFVLIIRSIVAPIKELTTAMDKSTITGKLTVVKLTGKDEITEIASYYNSLVNKLNQLFWMKDCQNSLNKKLSGFINIEDLTQSVISFLSRTLDAGKGAFYVYDRESKVLNLSAAYAYTERENSGQSYRLGEGIIGQVAIEGVPIFLKNINPVDSHISLGLMRGRASGVIAFPLIFEEVLYGVIELTFLEDLTEIKRDFITEAGKIIAINLFSSIQNEKISKLLKKAEEAERQIRERAGEMQIANSILEEQQRLLQQQAEELQQTNSELEEQQQLLQQQSEELQKNNAQMEEQQQLLENQSSLLSTKNRELEKSKQELLSYSKKLEVASKYKSEFLANMSHELRTPLNSIILLSRLLMKQRVEDFDGHQLEKLQIINSSGMELLRLIDEILDLSKIEAGRMDLNETVFSSSELLKELLQLFKSHAEEKGIKLTVVDKVDSLIFGDYNKISQILRNFIANAIKFTEKGSVILEAGFDGDEKVFFSVTDTGKGIAEDSLELIFEEFQQEDGSISRRFGGTGLGLSISKKLADLMSAEIRVSSSIGKGSSFRLCLRKYDLQSELQGVGAGDYAAATLDILDEALTERRSQPERSFGSTSKTNKEYAMRLDGKRILIVDDDPKNVFVLASALEAFGAEIIEAQEGEAALKLIKQEPVDLVLMDVIMPVMDGFQTIKLIRREKGIDKIPIIVITAKSRRSDRAECLAAGANDYISKPVDYDNLIHLVKAWIEKE